MPDLKNSVSTFKRSEMTLKTASRQRLELCSKTAARVTISSAVAGMITTSSASLARGESATLVITTTFAPNSSCAFDEILRVTRAAGTADRDQQVAPAGCGGNCLAGDVGCQPGVHQSHAEHPRDQAAAPGPGEESPLERRQHVRKFQKTVPVDPLHHRLDAA